MSIPPSMNPKLLDGDTYVVSMYVLNDAECTVILLTIASAGGPPLNISPSLICMCTASHVKFIGRFLTILALILFAYFLSLNASFQAFTISLLISLR